MAIFVNNLLKKSKKTKTLHQNNKLLVTSQMAFG